MADSSGSELQQLLDAEIEKAKAQLLWDMHLSSNEFFYGSAYGPWPKPHLTGLVTIITQD